MADTPANPSSSKKPEDIDESKEGGRKTKSEYKKRVRTDYKCKDGSAKIVSPCWWDIKCNICEQTFSRKLERDRHVKEVHTGEGRVKCPECDITFSRKETMLRHRDTSHASSSSSFKCDICHKTFPQQRNLERHRDEVHAGGHFECTECPATYTRKEKLQQHMESGRHKIAFYCGICHEYLAFRDMASLEQHVKVKEGSRRKGYGIKIYCASSKRNWGRDIYGGQGIKKEKENFIQEGLKKAQERN